MYLVYSTEVSLFFNIIPKNTDAFVPSSHKFEIRGYRNLILAFAVIHGRPFSLPYYCGIGDLQIVASVAGSVFLLYYPIVAEQRFSIDGKYYPGLRIKISREVLLRKTKETGLL